MFFSPDLWSFPKLFNYFLEEEEEAVLLMKQERAFLVCFSPLSHSKDL